jgi:putative Holliday junction resolvase
VILGIDPGERRVGVALADNETRFARPVEVIDVKAVDPFARIKELVAELSIETIVVGRPVGLSGGLGPAMESHVTFVTRLRSEVEIDVDVYDERLTTVIAERQMREAGLSAKKQKEMKDAVAAQVMLQGYMDSRR